MAGAQTSHAHTQGWLADLTSPHLSESRLCLQIDVLLWLTRIATMIFTVGYILPIMGNPYNSYYKALMASASTSALRLHQRLPQVQFNRQFLGESGWSPGLQL